MPASEMFTHQVGHALAHLYDPDILRRDPLLVAFGINDRPNPHTLLRNILVEGIEAIKPQLEIPLDSRSWRVYRLLHLRFIQQMDQVQTAYQLGIGVRHLRREQRASIQILADSLVDKFELDTSESNFLTGEKGAEKEFFWVKSPAEEVSTSTSEVFSKAIELVGVLAVKRNIRLLPDIPPDLPSIEINPAGLRQLSISLISYAINRVPKGQVVFKAFPHAEIISLHIHAKATGKLLPDTGENLARLEVVRSILNERDIQLNISEGPSKVYLSVQLPVTGLTRVLMVDDNADICQLVERYTAGTIYRFSFAKNSQEMFEIVREAQPKVIILDVMMPGMDGWEILGRLRQNPLTGEIPVIICSVLPERELALALGAAAYLPKPVMREALLDALRIVFNPG